MRLSSSTCAALQDDGWNSPRHQPEIEPERSALDIVEIEFHPLVEGKIGSPRNLPEPGDARFDAEPPPVFSGKGFDLVRKRGTWPDQAHLAAQHADQLRQLVDAQLA